MKPHSKSTPNPLKIGLVCDTSLDAPDGVQQYVITLGEWLRSRGHDVHYLTSNTARTDLSNLHVLSKNIQGNFNGNRLSSPLPASPIVVRDTLRHERFDVLHVQMPYSPLLAGQIIHFAKSRSAIVGTFHIFPQSPVVEFAGRALGLALLAQRRRFHTIMSVSRPAQEFARQAFHLDTRVVPNMFVYEKFAVKPPKRQGHVQILFLGRLVERKGCMHLLKAIAYMDKRVPPGREYSVRIGGKGPLRNDLESYVKLHGLQDKVYFDGFIPEADKPDYLASADIAVFPSTGGESFGISLLEAMAATPGVVLAGNNPGYRTVLGERPRQLFDPADTDTFAHMLARYIAKQDDRVAAHAWQSKYVQRYDVNIVGRRIEAVYQDALRLRAA